MKELTLIEYYNRNIIKWWVRLPPSVRDKYIMPVKQEKRYNFKIETNSTQDLKDDGSAVDYF